MAGWKSTRRQKLAVLLSSICRASTYTCCVSLPGVTKYRLPKPSPVYKAHCHKNVNCKFFSICCQLPCLRMCSILKENERKYISINLIILCLLLWLFITQYLSCFVRTTYEWLKPIYGISHLMPHATCCVVVIANDRTCCKVHFWVLFKSTIATFFVCGNFPLWDFSYSPTATAKAEFFKSERGHYSVVLATYFHMNTLSHFQHHSIWFHYRYKL